MADLIIKPSSGSLKLQEDGGTDAVTVDGTGKTTIADIALPNKYYLQLRSGGYGTYSSEMINNSGTTVPYFQAGVGDTTNIAAVNDHDFKLVRAGVYFISFHGTFYASTSHANRSVALQIRNNTSSPTSSEGTDILSSANDQCANTDNSNSDYAHASCSLIHNFSANHLINFYLTGIGATNIDVARASIVLIRPF